MGIPEYREDHIRYIRLCVLVIVKGREALEDYLQKRLQKQHGKHKPFSEILDESQTKRVLGEMETLSSEHRSLLYPKNNARVKDSSGEWLGPSNPNVTVRDLDINLLYMFLRHFCELMSSERNIWKNPWPGDNRPEACITRTRVYRNKLAYNKTHTISRKEFDELWNDRVSDLATLSQNYAPEYFKALATVQIAVYPNQTQIDGILKTMKTMADAVQDEIRDLEMELERLFESLSLSQAPKLVHLIDSIKGKSKRERSPRAKTLAPVHIPKTSKWNKLKLATIEQIEGDDKQTATPSTSREKTKAEPSPRKGASKWSKLKLLANEQNGVESERGKPATSSAERSIPSTSMVDSPRREESSDTASRASPIVEIHQPPSNIEDGFDANFENEEYRREKSPEVPDSGYVDDENDRDPSISIFDVTREDSADSFDRQPLVERNDGGDADGEDEDKKSRRKPFKLVSVLRDMMKVRDELDHNQEKIRTLLKRTSSEERTRSQSPVDRSAGDPKGGTSFSPPNSPDMSVKPKNNTEKATTFPMASREKETNVRTKRLGAMGPANAVGQLLQQIHTSGMKMASPEDSPVLPRKSVEIPESSKLKRESSPSRRRDGDGRDDSSSDGDEGWDSDDATNFLMKSRGQGSSGAGLGMGGDVMFLSMGKDSRRSGGYGRNNFGMNMGAGMYTAGFRPGVHAGTMGGYGYGRGRFRLGERKGTKYRSARSSGHSGRMRRGGRGGMMM